MAVVGSAKEVPGTRTSNFDGGVRTCSRTHLVKVDNKTDNESVVDGATGLPVYAEAHPAYSSAFAVSQGISEVGDSGGLGWHVTTGYSSARELNEDPEDDEVLIDWNSEIYQEIVQFDVNGKAVLNSAGDYFIDPTPSRDAIHMIARIEANVTDVPPFIISYQNAVNDNVVNIGGLICAAGLVKVQRMTIGKRQARNDTTFYPFSYEAHVHSDGWRLRPLDAGFRQIEYGELVQIKDGLGDEVTTPVPLDGAGQVLISPSPETGVFGDFTIYPELDLTVLPGIS
jgi:hypothetical protein